MKKILFGSAAAILSAISFSSFTTIQKSTDYYWFKVASASNDNPTGGYDNFVTQASTAFACTGTGSFFCENGYTASKIKTVSGVKVVKTVSGVYDTPTVIAKSATNHY